MATKPCDRCRAPAPGRLAGIYPALLIDGSRHTVKRQYCLPHMRELVAHHAKDWRDRALNDSAPQPGTCYGCGQVFDNSAQLSRFYATAYLDGKNRRDFDSQYCQRCVESIVQEFEFDV